MLNRRDVDFKTGTITVRQTKGHMEHFVVLHDSMRELLKSYDFSIENLLPGRKVLFPDEHDNYHKSKWLSDQFRTCWYKTEHSHFLRKGTKASVCNRKH